MNKSQSTNVFVSYSHADASLVAPVVQLLRANKSFVFQDLDTIRPGKKWRKEISNAIDKSHLVVVFWCNHSSRSDEVSKEWKAAIEQNKDLLPLLLDATPLHPKLSEYQWIDFRETVGENHRGIEEKVKDKAGAPSRKPGRWLFLGGLTIVLLATNFFLFLYPQAPSGQLEPIIRDGANSSNLLILLSIIFVVAAGLYWLWRRRSKRVKTKELEARIKVVRPHPSEIDQRIATELETEILRRTASRNDGVA